MGLSNDPSTYDYNSDGTYVAVWAKEVDSNPHLIDLLNKFGLPTQQIRTSHCTIAYSATHRLSKDDSAYIESMFSKLPRVLSVRVDRLEVWHNNDKTHLVAVLENHPDILRAHNFIKKNLSVPYGFDEYKPHVTIASLDGFYDYHEFDECLTPLESWFKSKPISFSSFTIEDIS